MRVVSLYASDYGTRTSCFFNGDGRGLPADADQSKDMLAAVKRGDTNAIVSLLDGNAKLIDARDTDGVTAARIAVYYRHPELARLLIDRGAHLDIYDAAAIGEMKTLRAEVERSASLANSYSTDGATPLGLAAFFGHKDAAEFLLSHGAKLDMVATNPAFPFAAIHSAMSGGHRDIFDLLLARGADVNVREGGGFTLLHEAAGLGNLEYIRLLLAHGANPSAKTDDGKLPEDFARERKLTEAQQVLAKARLSGLRP
jgi:ankyrin repeat protein